MTNSHCVNRARSSAPQGPAPHHDYRNLREKTFQPRGAGLEAVLEGLHRRRHDCGEHPSMSGGRRGAIHLNTALPRRETLLTWQIILRTTASYSGTVLWAAATALRSGCFAVALGCGFSG